MKYFATLNKSEVKSSLAQKITFLNEFQVNFLTMLLNLDF